MGLHVSCPVQILGCPLWTELRAPGTGTMERRVRGFGVLALCKLLLRLSWPRCPPLPMFLALRSGSELWEVWACPTAVNWAGEKGLGLGRLSSVMKNPIPFPALGLSQASFLLLTQAEAELRIWSGHRALIRAQTLLRTTCSHTATCTVHCGSAESHWYTAKLPYSHLHAGLSHKAPVMGLKRKQRGQCSQGVPVWWRRQTDSGSPGLMEGTEPVPSWGSFQSNVT